MEDLAKIWLRSFLSSFCTHIGLFLILSFCLLSHISMCFICPPRMGKTVRRQRERKRGRKEENTGKRNTRWDGRLSNVFTLFPLAKSIMAFTLKYNDGIELNQKLKNTTGPFRLRLIVKMGNFNGLFVPINPLLELVHCFHIEFNDGICTKLHRVRSTFKYN